jgi:hypothetical protein
LFPPGEARLYLFGNPNQPCASFGLADHSGVIF